MLTCKSNRELFFRKTFNIIQRNDELININQNKYIYLDSTKKKCFIKVILIKKLVWENAPNLVVRFNLANISFFLFFTFPFFNSN